MYGLRTIFAKLRQSTPFVATIPIIVGKYWFQRNDTNHTNFRPFIQFRSHLTLRSAQLNVDFQQLYDNSIGRVVQIKAGTGVGTGIIVSHLGLIVTNAHVVRGLSHVNVIFFYEYEIKDVLEGYDSTEDMSEMKGQVVYVWPHMDLALIKIYIKSDLFYDCDMSLSEPTIGEAVMAIGNPQDCEGAVAVGMIAGHYQWMTNSMDNQQFIHGMNSPENRYIIHSAPIFQGYSGGPLLNSTGHLIGVNFLRALHVRCAAFAPDVNEFIKSGEIFAKTMREKKYSMNGKKSLGVMVERQTDNSYRVVYIADKNPINENSDFGLQLDDIITEVDGIDLTSISQLTEAIDNINEENYLNLRVRRNSRHLNVTIDQLFDAKVSSV